MERTRDSRAAFEAALRAQALPRYVLRLYIAGQSPGSSRAVRNLTALCEAELAGRYDLEVIDVYQAPDRARLDQIVALPTLVRYQPEPVRRLVGDLSDRDVVRRGLDLRPQPGPTDDATRPPRKTRPKR